MTPSGPPSVEGVSAEIVDEATGPTRERMIGDTTSMDMPGAQTRSKIMMVQPTGVSGIWHYANSLARTLEQRGHDVVVVTQSPYERLGELGSGQVITIGTRESDAMPPMFRPIRRVLSHVGKMSRLLKLLMRARPHVIHLHAPLGGLDFLYFRIFRLLGARVVYTAHDAQPLTREANWFDSARYRAADWVIVHAKWCVDYLRTNGDDVGNIAFVPHGNYLHLCRNADLTRLDARRILGVPADAQVILFFGAISPYKGMDTLIAAFHQISQIDPRALLIIAGEPLEPFERYERQLQSLSIQERVRLDLRYLPFDDFAMYFRSADVVVLPHHRVSQSGTLHLAYGYARAVVVSDVGGMGEMVSEDQTGVVIPPNDGKALADGILQLLADPVRAEKMGRRARALAETKYSWDSIGTEMSTLYGSSSRGQVIRAIASNRRHH